jgi:uroporphyrin-III C-methyltransferase/precorrin-2 dehydrogenase/sirohydrochlorin ferrochelatase
MDSDMPIAVVQQGTTRDQKVLVSTLAELPEAVLQTPIKPPTIIIVGRVVKLKEKLAWFES